MTVAARQVVSLSRYFIRAALRLLLASSLVLWSRRDTRRYRGKPTVDLEVTWPVSDAVTLTVGARNVLNTYPDMNPNADRLGNRYPPSTPFGFNGGFYYTRLGYSWWAAD